MAVLQRDVQHLADEVRGWRVEMKEELARCQVHSGKQHDDHEQRLRSLEGSNRQGLYRDLGVFLSAIGAGVFGWLTGKP